ncbi:MAG TPA: monovalent cation/H+ antiporter subunit D family protein [Propionibacterium sp.]|nr:monovalent cation/H+ antiporter subunit D family protein [Propionibacterium sp.]
MSALLTMFVAVPLLSAGLLVVIRNHAVARALLLVVPAASAIGGGLLVAAHGSTPVLAHTVGTYLPGVGIVFVSDTLSALMLLLVGVLTALCAGFLMRTGEDELRLVPSLILLLLTGVNGALLTGDLFNLFVFIEVMLLPSYALIAVTGVWRRLGAGRMFVIVNLLASTVFVMGVGLVYGAAGTVNLAALAGAAQDDPQVSLAGAVVLFAMLVKAGVVPMHGWLPRAYPATSAGIMALFSGIHTKVGLYAVFRIYSTLYGGEATWLPILLALVIATVLVGSFATFGEKRIRGALAYQMVAGVGQILIGLVVFTQLSLTAGLFYMVHHMITMGGLILLSGALEHVYGTGRLDRLSGLLRRDRAVAAFMALGFLSLVGLPPTSGLWGKATLLGGAAQAGGATAWLLLGTVVAASIASLMALQHVWRNVFQGRPLELDVDDDVTTTWGDLWPGATLISISVALFVLAGVAWPFFDEAATRLIDLAPYLQAVMGS